MVALIAVCTAFLGCASAERGDSGVSTGSIAESPSTATGAEPDKPEDITPSTQQNPAASKGGPFAEVLPPDLLESANNLQAAIDQRLQADVQACMREAGFEYFPISFDSGSFSETNPVMDSIILLDPSQAGQSSAADRNRIARSVLSPSEQLKRDEVQTACYVESPNNIANPLGGQSQWWADVESAVNARVQADPRFAAAVELAAQCMADQGYPDGVEGERSRIDREAVLLSLEITDREAQLATLYQLLDEREALDELETTCDGPRAETNQQLYSQLLADALADDPRAELWVAEVRASVDDYSPELAELLDE